MLILELEKALIAALCPLQEEGFRVVGAPTDHAAVGRIFGSGEIRSSYRSRTWGNPKGLGTFRTQPATYLFEVVIELMEHRQFSHRYALRIVDKVIDLVTGKDPKGNCGGGFYPLADSFQGRDENDAVWIYKIDFAIDRIITRSL